MQTPKVCPVCGHDSIHPVKRTAFVRLEGEKDQEREVIGFRCGKGHLFLAPKQENDKLR